MKTGLIMEGGAMRGLFTAGVIDVFMENNITFDGAIGVSAGAAFGCNYKSGQIGRAIRYNKKYSKDKRYCSLRSLIRTGDLYGADFCYRELPEKLDVFDKEAFDNNPMEFYVVCTDIVTGKPVYHKIDLAEKDYLEWIRASASLPLASRIVEVGGYKLLDGGISDSIPLEYFQGIGYSKNVVILTQPLDYVKKKNKLIPLIRRVFKNYPMLVKAMEERHNVYNKTVEYICEMERQGKAFVVRPEKALPVKRVERDAGKLQNVYDIGRKIALEKLDEIKEYLGK